MAAHPNVPGNIYVKKFQKILVLLQIPAGQDLAEAHKELTETEPSSTVSIKEKVERYNTLLRKNKTLGLPEKFLYIFIAYSYTLSYFTGEEPHLIVAIKAAEKAILYARSENDDYHCALFNWFLGLLHCRAGNTGKSTQYLEKARQLLIGIQELYLGIHSKNKHELRSIEVNVNSDLETAAHWVLPKEDNQSQVPPITDDCPDPGIEDTLLDYIHKNLNHLSDENE